MAECEKCKLPHPPMADCIEAQRRTIQNLLMRCGRIDRCPDPCGQTLYWMQHLTGAKAPYTEAGLLHFLNCQGRYKKGTV